MVSMILGRKIGMTQVWDENDNVVPVTVVQAGPCTVSQVKTKATDGYDAVQLGFGDITSKHVNKPMAGHFAKAGVEPMRYLREVRVAEGEEHNTGDVVTVADFADVTTVDVTGTSKGLHMAGHMGDERVTVKNLKLVRVDAEQNLMLIKGAIPGGKNALVSIRMA